MFYSIPFIPESLNKYAGRNNTWQYRAAKKEWLNIIAVCCRPKPKEPFEKAIVTLTYFFHNNARRDPDNYSGKMIIDGLVNSKILKDDSFSNIELRIIGKCDKKNPRTEINIVENKESQ